MEPYRLVSWRRRALAWWIDLLIICIPLCVWLIGVWSNMGGRYRVESWYQEYLWLEWLPWAWLLFVYLYYGVAEALEGATPGKRLLSIRVVRIDGSPCGAVASAVRNLVRFLDALFFWWIGALIALATRRRQRLGDLLAGTVVVSKDPRE